MLISFQALVMYSLRLLLERMCNTPNIILYITCHNVPHVGQNLALTLASFDASFPRITPAMDQF